MRPVDQTPTEATDYAAISAVYGSLMAGVGELLGCTRCIGAWSALGLIALRLHSPAAGRTATTVLAASAGNDFLQTAFTLLCGRANAARREGEDTPRPFSPARRAA